MAHCSFPTGDIVADLIYQGMANSIQEYVSQGNDPSSWIAAVGDPASPFFWVQECVQANYLEAFVQAGQNAAAVASKTPPPNGGAAHDAYSPLGALMPSNESALFMAGAALILVFLFMRDKK